MTDDKDQTPPGWSFEEQMARLEAAFAAGDAEALMDAISLCLNQGAAAPEWVRRGYFIAWDVRYQYQGARTLGEAFGIERPKGWRQSTARKRVRAITIWQTVNRIRREEGLYTNRDLFEYVAERLNEEWAGEGITLNGTDVQEAFYTVQNAKPE